MTQVQSTIKVSRGFCGDVIQQFCNIAERPDVIDDAGLHGRGDPQALVNPAEVVVEKMQGDGVLVIFDFL